MGKEIFQYKVNFLPTIGKPNSVYYVPNGQGTDLDQYVSDVNGVLRKVNPIISNVSAVEITRVAGEDINAGVAVIIWTDNKIYKYDILNDNHTGLTCGITKTSALTGQNIVIVLPGSILKEVGSGWSTGLSYYVSSTSTLTTTAPILGIVKKIATGIDVDTVMINNYNEFITI